jgi:hypothetical protein
MIFNRSKVISLHVSQALPRLRTLEIFNEIGQQEKIKTTLNHLEFAYLTTLVLSNIHMDYAEQFRCRTCH